MMNAVLLAALVLLVSGGKIVSVGKTALSKLSFGGTSSQDDLTVIVESCRSLCSRLPEDKSNEVKAIVAPILQSFL